MGDQEAVLALARQAGFGMTSLPPDPQVLQQKIEGSVASFEGRYEKPGQESFFFVLEDTESDKIVGTAGIKARIGLSQPFYSYKITTITQISTQLDKFSKHEILQVTNDLTGSTEIGALFLHPSYRRDRMGKMMSLARFLFIAAFRERFAEQIIAEMRGVHDEEGKAPFYSSLARHFFDMSFADADYINATQGNQFINDLMPKYPIYVSLLPKRAQRVVGQVNAASAPARMLLEGQGFKYTGYIDIFDGGPTMVAARDQVDAVAGSVVGVVRQIIELPEETPKYVVSNDRFAEFRCAAGRVVPQADGTVAITPRLAARLGCVVGDTLRYYPL
jgi:arginine N-succinyltransferase